MRMPIETWQTADGELESTGLDYSDYRRMHVDDSNAPFSERRLETPEWVYNNKLLRDVLLCFLEYRAGMQGTGFRLGGTPKQRLKRAMKRLSARRKSLKAIKDQKNPIERKNIETQIRLAGTESKLVIGAIWHYYRLGKGSVETAQALGITPVHVRVLLQRLNRAYERVLELQRQREWHGPAMRINLLPKTGPGVLFKKIAIGQRFGRWTVLGDSGQRTCSGHVMWLCQCECGARKAVWGNTLRNGESKSCGCLQKEMAAEIGKQQKGRVHNPKGRNQHTRKKKTA